jgi:hypothetical protein
VHFTLFRQIRSFRRLPVVCGKAAHGQDAKPASFAYDMGPAPARAGHTQVLPDMTYSTDRGFGFEPGADVQAVERDAGGKKTSLIASAKPFLFSVAVPEGNYQVRVTLGDPGGDSKTTIKAELRRLMIEKAHAVQEV